MDIGNFTQPVVKGTNYTKMLPQSTALVLEGGGTRGFYSAGVFEAFMDEGVMFPYIAGVSAGAANALSYVSGQRGRNRVIVEKYVSNHRYVSYRNMLRCGTLFGYDFIFDTIPRQHIFWDKDVFDSADIRLLTGTTDCATGETIWFEKQDILPGLAVTRASCSVPILSKIITYNGYQLLDGGISSPIPIEKSIEDGNTFHVIVLTRNRGYTRKAFRLRGALKLFYGKYPMLIEALMKQHEVYNRQLALCEQLEREKKAVIIRPLIPLDVGRTTRDTAKLLALYDEGHIEGTQAIDTLKILLLNSEDERT